MGFSGGVNNARLVTNKRVWGARLSRVPLRAVGYGPALSYEHTRNLADEACSGKASVW